MAMQLPTKERITDRKVIYITGMPLDEVVEKILQLKGEGWEELKQDYDDEYDCITTKIEATRMRLETDEEFEARVQAMKERERWEREHYERLKARFEPQLPHSTHAAP